MKKADLIAKMAVSADISKNKAEFALDSAIEAIITALTHDEKVKLIGFGTFLTGNRSARIGRNPKTGEAVEVCAAKTVKFTAGKTLKEAINKK